MKFDDYFISKTIKDNLDKLGFKKPTDIQYKSIPHILTGEDVLAIAQTGTGKTAAFAIPIIDIIHSKKSTKREDGIKCVIMTPTHELAIQIHEVFEKISKHTRVKSFCIHGGVDQMPQINKLEEGLDVVIATPGRLFDLVSQGHLKLNRVNTLVLDEADHMLDLGFINDIRSLIHKLPQKRQTLFFSATIDAKIKKLAYSLVNNPIRIQISPKDRVSKNINHSVAYIDMDDKRFFLERLIKENPDSKILIFVRTKIRAERVFKAMERVDIISKTIHGSKDQKERSQVMNDFKDGKFKILIATDVSARGIDIPNVEYVVNYDLPEQEENYVHRVGRTGRANNKGNAVSFCSEEESSVLEKIEEFLTKPIEVLEIKKDDYSKTIEYSHSKTDDWKTLIEDNENFKPKRKRKKKK